MSPFYFVLGCLATYRLSLLLSKEDGPAWVFRKLRNVPPKKSSAHEGIRCIWCVGIWMSALVTGYFFCLDLIEPVMLPVYWLSFAAGAIIINQQWTKGD